MVTHLWPIGFQLMAALGIFECFLKLANASVGCRAVAEKKEVVAIESDGLGVAFDGLQEVALFWWVHHCRGREEGEGGEGQGGRGGG